MREQTAFTETDQRWIFTGSSVSGIGYGFAIYRDDSALGIRHAVRLVFGGQARMVQADSYSDAYALGQRFAHAWYCWNVVQARNLALAAGFAVLG